MVYEGETRGGAQKSLLDELRLLHITLKRGMSKFCEDGETLPVMGAMTLRYIAEHGGSVPQKEIESTFNLRRSTASEIIRKLETDGYVVRKCGEEDKRSKLLFLTDKARAEHAMRMRKFEALEAFLQSGLSESECETFCVLAEKLRRHIDPDAE